MALRIRDEKVARTRTNREMVTTGSGKSDEIPREI